MTPAQIAREALRRLAVERRIPSPENYGDLYNEIAGKDGADTEGRAEEQRLTHAANSLASAGRHTEAAARVIAALADRTWPSSRTALLAMIEPWLEPHAHGGPAGEAAASPPAGVAHGEMLRDILARLLESGVAAHLSENDDLLVEGRMLAGRVRKAHDESALAAVSQDLLAYCARLEERSAALKSLRDGLARLLRLLIENTTELIVEDTWVRDQLALVRDIVAQSPADLEAMEEAEQFLREALKRQGEFKRALAESKAALREMAAAFAAHLASMTADTGSYGEALEGHAERVRRAPDMAALKAAVDALLADTRGMRARTAERHREWVATRERAAAAEKRVQELENEIACTTRRLIEDHLTSTLNRRGLDEFYSREAARAERSGKPLAVAMLDVDDFKKMNDRLGHQAGDKALAHLAHVIKKTIRPSDIVARYGGEEFLLLLPETGLEQGEALVARLQRELTRHFFLHNNERVLMTFSAGLTLWRPGEDQASLIARADAALYDAKRTGKNKVVAAPLAGPRPAVPLPAAAAA